MGGRAKNFTQINLIKIQFIKSKKNTEAKMTLVIFFEQYEILRIPELKSETDNSIGNFSDKLISIELPSKLKLITAFRGIEELG